MARVSVFLIVVVLIAEMSGCLTPFRMQYQLTISSTGGGSVITPGEGVFTYWEGTIVDLTVEVEAGYCFNGWAGNVSTVGNVTSTTTKITMDCDHAITANFEEISVVQYQLAINSTEGGNVTTPGEGVFTYDEGTVVGLVAEAEEGYTFVEWVGDVSTIADVYASSTTITVVENYSITAKFGYTPMVAAGSWHTVGLTSSGRVVATGKNDDGQCNVNGWTNITQVTAGRAHTVGLESDGTVVATGYNGYGQCDVDTWTDIVQVAGGVFHTVGIKTDGTVVAVGRNSEGQCNVELWMNITQVIAGSVHTVGLRDDATVVAVGLDYDGECSVDDWDLN